MTTLLEPAPETRSAIASRRFLVVDDFSTMRRIVCCLLKELGGESIFEAEDGLDALGKLGKCAIDFVISDWNMPKLTGLELLKAVRANGGPARMPFLLITAESRKENILDAARAGADGYIVKPFTSNVLGEKIRAILSRRSEA